MVSATSIPPKYEHQTEAIRSSDGKSAHIITSPTGTGKTRMELEIGARELGLGQTVILTNGNRSMMDQLHEEAKDFLTPKHVHFAYKSKGYLPGKLNIQSYNKLYSTYELSLIHI